ncbi:MAG: Fe-S cluster assembly protein NifU [Lentisphaerae bacterium RIFOXYC12_FULL_60_16]|nr:MAG: Fe-S cluster assembly protein NifU [Lentisphaerae bacterium RIFOXYC12_FULL_60_16]
MWDYTEKVMDHFRNPRNVGVIPDADGVGLVGSMACGDALKLTFKLGPDRRIADARFQTFGCASAIASSSALTEMIKGKTLAEAEKITNQDIADFLGGLPEQKMHCSVLGREALEAAIANFRTGNTVQKAIDGKIVCACFGVTDKEIERVIRDNHLTTVEQITHYCKAGGGCGQCKPELGRMLEKILQEQPAQPTTTEPARRLTIVERLRLIEETLNREIRPALQKDGGDVELVDIQGTRIVVSLRGRCAQCQVSRFTLKDVVEAKLREFVAPDIEVVEERA